MGNGRGLMQTMLTRTRHYQRRQKLMPSEGKNLACVKCGYVPIGWTRTRDPDAAVDTYTYIFRCFRCHLPDEFVLVGNCLDILDAYARLVDRFNNAVKAKQQVVIEEQPPMMQVQSSK